MKTRALIVVDLAVRARTVITTRHLIFHPTRFGICLLAFALIATWPPPALAAVIEAWVQRYSNVQSNASAQAVKVVRDAVGDIIVTGSTGRPGTGRQDILTIKYSGADGSVLWQRRYNNPFVADTRPSALAVDGSGNVVVTGNSDVGAIAPVYLGYTAKYAAADGALLWEKRYDSGGLTAVAVDGSGNVLATGYSYNGTNTDYYGAKYAAADGALIWERRNIGRFKHSYVNAMVMDASGSVLISGDSGGDLESESYIVKYAAATGELLWEKHNNKGGGAAMVVDDSGNVVVTGTSGSDSFGNALYDYYTVKYAAADGALLWEKRFAGPASSGESSHYLALGPNGMVAVTGTVNGGYATVVYREVPAAVSIERLPTGVRLRFSGISGRTYNIERAPAVTGPWSTINNQTASASGAFEYLDTNPPVPAAFYRTSEPGIPAKPNGQLSSIPGA